MVIGVVIAQSGEKMFKQSTIDKALIGQRLHFRITTTILKHQKIDGSCRTSNLRAPQCRQLHPGSAGDSERDKLSPLVQRQVSSSTSLRTGLLPFLQYHI